jgi:SAM-dependent methyltransferase
MICNICNNTEFIFPEFRIGKSLTVYQGNEDLPPMCASCKSLERHRIIKKVYFANKKSNKKPLLFSKDPAKKYLPSITEISIYGKENSIDIQKIDRDNESYDLIFHHHILEHIENDELAFSELCRILAKGGQMFWSVPSPTILKETIIDDPEKNSLRHYRWYGEDFINIVEHWSKKYKVRTKLVYETDEVTKFQDLIFITEK